MGRYANSWTQLFGRVQIVVSYYFPARLFTPDSKYDHIFRSDSCPQPAGPPKSWYREIGDLSCPIISVNHQKTLIIKDFRPILIFPIACLGAWASKSWFSLFHFRHFRALLYGPGHQNIRICSKFSNFFSQIELSRISWCRITFRDTVGQLDSMRL